MLVPQTADDWRRLLLELGVEADVAPARATTFAATIREDTFSAGLERELPDFLTTVLHESRMLEKLKESGKYRARRIREMASASGPGTRWRSLLPRAEELASENGVNREDAFFEALYSGRYGNGPEGAGDGARYPGRAFIGLTFKDNYARVGDVLGRDLVGDPRQAEDPTLALQITIAWWEGHVPDHCLGDRRKVRKAVNGGYIGMPEVDRLASLVSRVMQC